jgi:6,7-dimethyl-8-ribityllumazine synthase
MSHEGQPGAAPEIRLPSDATIAVAVARFNSAITEKMLDGVYAALPGVGGTSHQIEVVRVPGAFELPLIAQRLAYTFAYDAVICLGCVIRGDTDHYNYVCTGAMEGILQAGLKTGIPVIFGVLTTDNLQQAVDRSGGKDGNKGQDALLAAVEMIGVLQEVNKKQASPLRVAERIKNSGAGAGFDRMLGELNPLNWPWGGKKPSV